MGGLEARTWQEVGLVGPITLFGAAVILAASRELDALLLGETQAASMGVDVERVRRRLIVATSFVVGAAVAVSGIIGFVGLVIPHILRLLVGPAHGRLLPLSLLYGAAFLVAADALARSLLAPEELRLGVMTAAIGAPFFLFLLLQRRREYSIE
jgi:iron complex transport system permease protein